MENWYFGGEFRVKGVGELEGDVDDEARPEENLTLLLSGFQPDG